MAKLWVSLVRPIAHLLPRVQEPTKSNQVKLNEKLWWIALTLLVFLVCSQVPLYGIRASSTNDPISFYRVMLASNKGSLMELGISPLITSGMIMQMLAGAKLVVVDQQNPEERSLFQAAEKIVGLVITLGQASLYTFFGMYGPISDLGMGNALIIILQLTASGILVLLMDDLLNNGYGFGSAISLFIACNICESIIWQSFSFRTLQTASGPQYEGAVIALFSLLVTRKDKIPALKEAFYRDNAANITNLLATILVFCIVIYFQGFRKEIPLKSSRFRSTGGAQTTFPIKLFYTSNIPIILQSALVSNIFMISQMAWGRMGHNAITTLLGRWAMTPSGRSIPVGGLVYYMSAPRSLMEVINDPIHALAYIAFVLSTCAILSYSWLGVSGSSAKDVAANLTAQGLTIPNRRAQATRPALEKFIPTAAAFGGLCIGALTIFADFMGAIGSGTGILLAVGIILKYVEDIIKQQNEEGDNPFPFAANLFTALKA